MKDYKERLNELVTKYTIYRDCSKVMKEKNEHNRANVPLSKLYESEETIYAVFAKELEDILDDGPRMY